MGWPTARTSDAEGGRIETEITPDGFKSKRHKSNQTFGAKLRDAVETYEEKNWATPQAFDHVNIVRTPEKLAKTRAEKNAGCMNLREQVHYPDMDHSRKTAKAWPTVQASEARQGYQDRTNGKKGSQKSLTTVAVDTHLDQAKPNTNGNSQGSPKLNPNWVEQLMGLPVGWTQL